MRSAIRAALALLTVFTVFHFAHASRLRAAAPVTTAGCGATLR